MLFEEAKSIVIFKGFIFLFFHVPARGDLSQSFTVLWNMTSKAGTLCSGHTLWDCVMLPCYTAQSYIPHTSPHPFLQGWASIHYNILTSKPQCKLLEGGVSRPAVSSFLLCSVWWYNCLVTYAVSQCSTCNEKDCLGWLWTDDDTVLRHVWANVRRFWRYVKSQF